MLKFTLFFKTITCTEQRILGIELLEKTKLIIINTKTQRNQRVKI
jgi:hypothetical protein